MENLYKVKNEMIVLTWYGSQLEHQVASWQMDTFVSSVAHRLRDAQRVWCQMQSVRRMKLPLASVFGKYA